jgi:hypothetical protein
MNYSAVIIMICSINICSGWGLLDRSTAGYFYKQLKTSLYKPTGNLLKNPFNRKCVFKNNLQLLEKKVFVSNKCNTLNGILLNKWHISLNLQYISI